MAVVLDYDNVSAPARRLACQILTDFTRECSQYQRELLILGVSGEVGKHVLSVTKKKNLKILKKKLKMYQKRNKFFFIFRPI